MRFVNLLTLTLLLAPGLVFADFTLLNANFDEKLVDEPIGLGGAEQGEPIIVDSYLQATVRDTGFPTPNLEIRRTTDGSASSVVFEFVNSASVDVGNLFLSFDVIINDTTSFNLVDVREQGSYGSSFCNIYTDVVGNIRLNDAAGYFGVIGSYVTGQNYHFLVDFDTEADTYDLLIDGSLVVDDRANGMAGLGIGRLIFKHMHTTAVDMSFQIDNLLVTADEYTAATPSSFSEVKLRF